MRIPGRRALVTGGALRVGRAIVEAFASAGAKVAIQYNASEKEAKELLRSLGGEEAGHRIVRCDLHGDSSIKSMMESLGPLDILVNNAASFVQAPFLKEGMEEAKRQFEINFWTPLALMKAFAEGNPSAEELAVVNIIDQRVVKADPAGFSYPLSKKALAEATKAAALQLAPRVRVNALAPGPVFPPPGMESSKMEKTLASLPLRRPVSAKGLADACVFLASNSSITGSALFVDCGQSLIP